MKFSQLSIGECNIFFIPTSCTDRESQSLFCTYFFSGLIFNKNVIRKGYE